MTTDRTISTNQRVLLQLSLMAVLAIWGLAVMSLGLSGAFAQDPQPAQPADGDTSGDTSDNAGDNGGGEAAAEPAKLRIGYINLERVIKEYPLWYKRFKALKDKSDEKERELKEVEQELRLKKAEIEAGKDVSEETFAEFQRKAKMFELNTRKIKSDLEGQIRELSTTVYDDAYKMVEAATKGQYDLVLGVNERAIRTGTQGEFFQKMTVRAVVIYDGSAELTESIILKLQAKSIKDGETTLDELNEHRKKLGHDPVKWNAAGDALEK